MVVNCIVYFVVDVTLGGLNGVYNIASCGY